VIQCSIPVFEYLVPPPHNEIIADLLYELATWHALAKLRLHTDTTVRFLEGSTTRLGTVMRMFASTTCKAFYTVELPSEETARRRRAVLAANGMQVALRRKAKNLNTATYKFHALGDYANAIRRFGTTDNYSTQTVCIYSTTFFVLTLG
jgi:hypothetical protein